MAEQIISASGVQYPLIVNSDGSINIAGVTIGSVSIAAGSESYIKGGSISVYNMVAGSIVYMPAVSVTAGSESYIKGGSISVYGVGSSYIVNQYLGSKSYQGDIYGVSGIVEVSNRVAGSIVDLPNVVGVSGTYFQNMIGSVRSQNVQITSPWVVSGNVLVSGTVGIRSPETIGSWTGCVGSIWSMPNISVSVGSESYIKAGSVEVYNMVAGSIVYMPSVNVSVGSNFYIKGGSLDGVSQFAGSIWSMPNVNVSTGSEMWLKGGSIHLYSGTSYIDISNTVQVAGSIWSIPSITANTGSEVWVKAGSIEVYTGSIYVTNFEAGTGYAGSEIWIKNTVEVSGTIVGSIISMPAINVAVGSESWIKGGSIHLYSGTSYIDVPNRVAGSIVDMPIVGISGTYFSNMIGSVRAQVVQITTPWQMAGSIWSMPDVNVSVGSETYIKGGSIHLYSGTSYIDIANVVQTAGSIWSMPSVTANAGSEQWIKGGSIHLYSGTSFIDVANTVQIAGSIWSIPNVAVSLTTGSEQWIKGGSIQTYNPIGIGSIMQGVSPFHINKTPLTYTGSLIVSGGTADVYIGSHVVALNNEVNWISVIGSIGSSYYFEVKDSEGYTILSNLPRTGRLSYMTPFLASGDIVFIISGAQVSGNYPLRIGYT
jgi:hypothetical protein